MAKTNHTPKSSLEKQLYVNALGHEGGDSTAEDDFLRPNPDESDVPQEPDKKVTKDSPKKKRHGGKGINGHIKSNLATYIVGIVSLGIMVIGIGLNGKLERINSLMEFQKDTITRLESDIITLQGKLQESIIKIQEQSLRIEFIEKLIQKQSP